MRTLTISRMGALATAAAILIGAQGAQAAGEGIGHVPARAGAPYSAATIVGGVVYVSGQLGLGADGKLVDGFEAQTKQAMENVKTVLAGQGLGLGDVFKCTALLTDAANWGAFNPLYASYFETGKMPARTAAVVASLPASAAVEIECLAKAK